MKPCAHFDEVVHAVRGGQWPQGCAEELRQHVAQCVRCTEEIDLAKTFAHARESAMRSTPLQSPELLWWKAQLRRRQSARERFERPAWTISAAAAGLTVVLLIASLTLLSGHLDLRGTVKAAALTWGTWTLVSLAAVLAAFVSIAVLTAAGCFEKER